LSNLFKYSGQVFLLCPSGCFSCGNLGFEKLSGLNVLGFFLKLPGVKPYLFLILFILGEISFPANHVSSNMFLDLRRNIILGSDFARCGSHLPEDV
jgi:hypothetical protein